MMNRRNFLRALGLAGGTALTLPSLLSTSHAGGENGPPKRLIMISHIFGWTYNDWKLRVGNKPEDKAWELDLKSLDKSDFSKPLQPFYNHRERLLALDGLSLATAELDIDGYRHSKGWLQAWTGNWAYFNGGGLRAQSASVDQMVARKIARKDRLSSIEMAVLGLEEPRNISHAGFNMPMPLETSPAALWQRLFGSSQSPDPLTNRQKSVMDYAYNEYKSLGYKLSKDDKERLESHFALVRDLELRITGMSQAGCGTTPKVPDSLSSYDEHFDAFVDLTAAAFSCDLTRVASFSLSDLPTKDYGWDHVSDSTHKTLAHEIYNSPTAYKAMTDFVTKHAEQVARLVQRLSEIKEPDGSSVMDNTLIVWGSENADGWHGYLDYCPLLIGGSWHFKTGRYMHWPHETPISLMSATAKSGYTERCGKPHQQMLVSVAQAMGVNTNKVGIARAQNKKGEWVNCSGPLPNLT